MPVPALGAEVPRWKASANGNNYMINFKSAAQCRQKLEAASIIGAWVSEAVEREIIEEPALLIDLFSRRVIG